MKRAPILGMLLALACVPIVVPVASSAAPKIGAKDNGFSITDEHYLRIYVACWAEFKDQCGRNIVDDGTASGNPPSKAQVADSMATMDRWLNPPVVREPIAESSPAPIASTPTTSVAPSSAAPSTVQCESGGDYSINTGNGYYGGYQFDSGTWDAYGDPAYGEANEAPPAVQDAAAASVPYDAWPNC